VLHDFPIPLLIFGLLLFLLVTRQHPRGYVRRIIIDLTKDQQLINGHGINAFRLLYSTFGILIDLLF
jgi:hypothetical protein